MAQSLSMILLHLVFSTKNRERWIDDAMRPGLHAYLAGACRAVGSQAYRVGGTDDHIHVACTLPRTLTVGKGDVTPFQGSDAGGILTQGDALS